MNCMPIPAPAAALRALTLLLLLLAVGMAAAEQPLRSPADTRSYEYFELDNGMQAIVISDPDTDKAAAAVDVMVGSGYDPRDRQGLAHFLEHMLFLGTEKYPDAGEYQAFISRHGGSHNAYTAFENTNYFFDIDKNHLEPALDRFSQFFVAPLFNAEYVDREKNAVHSEYQAKLKDDNRRIYAVMQSAANPAHPFSTFSVGSLETLAERPGGPSLRDELVRFYRNYYAARRMRVVVLGAEPLDVLRGWVEEKFSAVPDPEPAPLAIEAPLFKPGTLPLRLDVQPVKEQRSVTLSFPLPPQREHLLTKPLDYIGNLVGHEGEGSLLSALKRAGWAERLSAGASLDTLDAAAFSINIDLTPEGSAHVEDVLGHTFAYLQMLREQGIEQWRYEEQQRIAELRYRFEEKMPAVSHVSRIATDLQHVPARDVLRLPYAYDAFDAGLIGSLAAQLTPENVMVTVVSPEVATDREETWYGTPYSRRALQLAGAALPVPAEAGLALPGPNPFIPAPAQLAVIDADMQRPALLDDASPVTLWHYADTSFGQPRAAFWFSVRSAFANDNPRNDMLSQLYVRLVKDQLNEFTYPATLAGLHFDIYRHVRGFTVKLDGYNARQDALLQAILPKLREPTLSEARFEAVKAELVREIQNRERDRPYQQTAREIMELMLRPGWTDELELEALAPLTLSDLRDYLPVLFSRVELVALAHGNLDAGAARDMAADLAGGLLGGDAGNDVPAARIVRLGAGDDYLRRLAIDHPDSAITMYFQGPDRQVRTRAVVELFAQLVSAPFYNDLRTEKQLGYVVFAGPSTLLDVPGLMFVVQSPVATPGMLENHIQAFLHDYINALPQMSHDQFEANKQGLISRLTQADERLNERSERLWQEIDLGYRQFDSREQLVAAIEPLDVQTVSKAMAEWLLGEQSRRVAITALGQGSDAQAQPEMVRSPSPQLIEYPASFGRFKQTYLASGRAPSPSEDGGGESRTESDAVAPPAQ